VEQVIAIFKKVFAQREDGRKMKWVVVGFYILAVLVISVMSMRKTHNVNDYFLGSRSIGP
jgi:Fe2+ transport system protein B